MNYIYEFDIAACCLIGILIFLLGIKRNYPSLTNKIYFAMLFSGLAVNVLDLITVYTIGHATTVPLNLNYFFNALYLLAITGSAILYFSYVNTLTKGNRITSADKIMYVAAAVLDIGLIVSTPITKFIFYFDKNMQYHHGPYMFVLHVIGIIMILYPLIWERKYRYKLTKFQTISIYSFSILLLVAIVIQFVVENLLLHGFACALFLMMTYISLQNPDDYMDKNTHCYNYAAFYDRTDKYMIKKVQFTVIGFLIDDFKYINHILGAEEGHKIIDCISEDMQNIFGQKRVYHLRDCTYAVIVTDGPEVVADALEEIEKYFDAPYISGDIEMQLIPRICKVNYPDFANTVEDITDAIENCLKASTQSSEVSVITATEDSIKIKNRENQIIHVIKRAIANEEFQVYFQPIFSVKDQKFTTAEALVRLIDKDLGFIPPDEFIPIAEQNGTIIKIGEIVFKKVCEFLKSSEAIELGVEYIEVNLSTIQCMQDNLANVLFEIMEEYDISPSRINFEITETSQSSNDNTLRKMMDTLIELGSTFSMDDYGTGFSTANYLITLPMSIVKIDRSILWSAIKQKEAFTILKHTVKMLRSLNKRIVVEGVEDENMVDMLIVMGVDYLQGYYYSKPVPANDYIEFLKSKQ